MTQQPPVSLPAIARLSRSEAQARTLLAQRARALAVKIGEDTWHLTIAPLASGDALRFGADDWRVRGEWAGASIELFLPAASGDAWLRARFADLDLPSLPQELRAAALEEAFAQALGAVNAMQRGLARIEGFARDDAPPSLPHRFGIELARGEEVVYGTLMTDPLGLMLMAGLVSQRMPAPSPLDDDALPILLRAEIGATAIGAGDLEALAVGDAVFVEHAWVGQDAELWLAAADGWGLKVKQEESRLVVTQPFNRTGLNMATETDTPAASLDALPVQLRFDLGERSISLGELKALQVGQTLELARPLSQAVTIRANGALIGRGELVDIDGRLAISITALGA